MGMIGHLVAVSRNQLQTFIADPTLIETFLYPDDDAEPANHLDLDKAWDAIHFTLNGKNWEGKDWRDEGPLFLAVLGGAAVGDDMGYGPARYLTPEQVRALSDALSAVTPEIFAGQFDPPALAEAEIYPQIWDEGAESLKYVQPCYNDLRTFYLNAAERGDAVLTYIN